MQTERVFFFCSGFRRFRQGTLRFPTLSTKVVLFTETPRLFYTWRHACTTAHAYAPPPSLAVWYWTAGDWARARVERVDTVGRRYFVRLAARCSGAGPDRGAQWAGGELRGE